MTPSALSGFNKPKDSQPSHVTIYDSTLRDGEQMPGVSFSESQKIEIAEMLAGIGVPQIEAGFPAVSHQEMCTVRKVAGLGLGSEILALSRTCRPDIDAAIQADVDMVMLFTATSELHLNYKYKITKDEQLAKVTDALEYAKAHGLKFSFSTEDSTRTDYSYLREISILAQELGACRIGISDTTGCILPSALGPLVNSLMKHINVQFSVHLHNDFGLALANALAAVENGATAVATTINGMGERAGNVPTEQLAMALEQFYGIPTGIDLSGLTRVCNRVSEISGVPISPNHPWVGPNAFRHESGIHVAAIMSNPSTYECVGPETVGGKREFVLGKHSGKAAVSGKLAQLGISVSPDELGTLVSGIKSLSEQGQKVDDARIMKIVDNIRGNSNERRQ